MALESHANTSILHEWGHDHINHSYLPKWPDAVSHDERPQIPSPSLFNFQQAPPTELSSAAQKRDTVKDGNDIYNRLPTVAECAAHLELLEVFFVIRQTVLSSKDIDKSMGTEPKREHKVGKKGDTKTLKDNTLWERRQVKWERYLDFATVRFMAWMDGLTKEDVMGEPGEPRYPKHLPPLDILMVWHSFLLNPKLFYDNCHKRLIWRLRLPWEAIHEAINSDDWTFTLKARDDTEYHRRSGFPADLYQSFCSWVHRYNWQSPTPETNFPVPLTSISLEKAKYCGTVSKPHDTQAKRIAHQYCSLFSVANVELALELKSAVIRQSTFVDKMNAHLWIRSPAVEDTLRRALDRYNKFLGILARKKFTIVPTLDVDLVWHTNQCYSGLGYAAAMKSRVGRFINHDDTIGKETLGDGFGETRKLWRIYYGKEYRICGCWDCEALVSEVEKVSSPEDLERIADRVGQKVEFHRVVEVKRRKKLPLPAVPANLR